MLTRRQSDVLAFIRSYVAAKGYAPSLHEIGAALGLSSLATVHKHLENLKEKGYIERQWNKSRSMLPSGLCPTCGQAVSVGKSAAVAGG